MASNKPESWGFRGMAGLLKDLGPRKGQRKVYQEIKELYQNAIKLGAGEPPHEWRPPGMGSAEIAVLARRSLQAALELREKSTISKPSDREKECHVKLLGLATKMGDLMRLQEVQVRIDKANHEFQKHAHGVTKRLDLWNKAVSAPVCTKYKPLEGGFRTGQKEYDWEPGHLIRAYHTMTSSPKAIALMEDNSPGNDLLLLPSKGGWEAVTSFIKGEKIIEDYPSMLEQPWRKAVALRLKMVTLRETDGRQDKEITYVQMAPMFKPEYKYYDKRIGISPHTYVENKLELAPLPTEAKLEPAGRYGMR